MPSVKPIFFAALPNESPNSVAVSELILESTIAMVGTEEIPKKMAFFKLPNALGDVILPEGAPAGPLCQGLWLSSGANCGGISIWLGCILVANAAWLNVIKQVANMKKPFVFFA